MTGRQCALSQPDNVFKSISKESLTGMKIERETKRETEKAQMVETRGDGRGRKQKRKPEVKIKKENK